MTKNNPLAPYLQIAEQFTIQGAGQRQRAHVFIADKENGNIRFVDPQTNNRDASNNFERGKKKRFGYLRMDDKNIISDEKIIKQAVEANKK